MDNDRLSIESAPKCRICLTTTDGNEVFISPCNCAGNKGILLSNCISLSLERKYVSLQESFLKITNT